MNEDVVTCPYCGVDFEINHDDGTHYEEGSASDFCPNCNLQVIIETTIAYYHDIEKADCLNGLADHDWSEWNRHWPVENYTKWKAERYCRVCDKHEQALLDVTDDPDEQYRLNVYREIESK